MSYSETHRATLVPQVGWGEEKEEGVTSGGAQPSMGDSELGRPGQTSATAQGLSEAETSSKWMLTKLG